MTTVFQNTSLLSEGQSFSSTWLQVPRETCGFQHTPASTHRLPRFASLQGDSKVEEVGKAELLNKCFPIVSTKIQTIFSINHISAMEVPKAVLSLPIKKFMLPGRHIVSPFERSWTRNYIAVNHPVQPVLQNLGRYAPRMEKISCLSILRADRRTALSHRATDQQL